MSKLPYRRDIDGLRTLAVVPVVLGHAGVAGFSGGFVGVDVFFVISGFLITGILARELGEGTFSILRFYERRARRILPALFAVLITCFVVGYLILPPDMYSGLAKSTGATLAFLSNVWFYRSTGDYFGVLAELEPLLHTWSLAVEEQFYIVFPLLLWLLAGRPGRRRWFQGRTATIWGVILMSVLSLALSVWATPRMPEANFYLSPTRAWELGLGALVALWLIPAPDRTTAPWTPPVLLRDLAGLLGLALILVSILTYDKYLPFPGLTAIPPCLGTALILWAGAHPGGDRLTPSARILSFAPFVWIGLISYSLYLWHWPVQVLFRVIGHSLHLSAYHIVLSVVLAVALAWVSWRFIERPFRRPPPAGFGQGAIFGMSLAGGVALGAMALAIFFTGGLTARIAPDTLAMYQEAEQMPPRRRACLNRTPDPAKGVDLCRIGQADPAAEDQVLIWGDSHVDALLPGVEVWLNDQGRSGFVAEKSGCAPVLGLKRALKGGGERGCDTHNDAVMAYLLEHPEIRTVLLHARWAVAVEGHRPRREGGEPFVFVPSDTPAGPGDPANNHDHMVAGLERTIGALRAAGRRVVVIDTVPEIGWSVPQGLFLQQHAGIMPPPPPDLDSAAARNARFSAMIAPYVARGEAELFSLAGTLCSPQCRIAQEGHALYRDDDHLSVYGAQIYGPPLLRRIFAD